MTMKYLIWANFKMNKSVAELKAYLDEFVRDYSCFTNADVFISPVSIGLALASEHLEKSCVALGAQNMHFEESGAYTGEISPKMLAELGCKYVLVGHSERRAYFHETDEIINKKIKSALANGIRPILCVGEDLPTRELGLAKESIKIQLFRGLEGVEDWSKIDIAYEPVWAIGTGKSATSEYAGEIHDYIRTFFQNDETRIIYGGSVTETNSKDFMSQKNVNGLLVGGASLDPKRFMKLIGEGISAK